MDINYISPYIRVAWDCIVDPPIYIRERVIFDYMLLYIKNGKITVNIENQTYQGVPGDLFLFKPKQHHSIFANGDSQLRLPHIHFDFFYQSDSPEVKVPAKPLKSMSQEELKYFRKDITNNFFNPFPNFIRLKNPLVVEKMLFDIINEFNSRIPFYETSLKGLFILLWSQLVREVYWSNNSYIYSNMEVLNSVKNYIEANYNKEITLEDLSYFAHLNKLYLSTIFKKTFGVTPIKYHRMIRIKKAREMIQYTNLSLNEITYKLGFKSIYSFSRAFKKCENVSPSFYRR